MGKLPFDEACYPDHGVVYCGRFRDCMMITMADLTDYCYAPNGLHWLASDLGTLSSGDVGLFGLNRCAAPGSFCLADSDAMMLFLKLRWTAARAQFVGLSVL